MRFRRTWIAVVAAASLAGCGGGGGGGGGAGACSSAIDAACATGCRDGSCEVPAPVGQQLPATGVVFSAFACGSSHGDQVQTSREHVHTAILGEPTPTPVGGFAVQSSDGHRNIGGFNAALH